MSDDPHKDKLSDFLSVSPDVFWETDTTGRLTFLSMQITSLIDQPPEAFLGKPLSSVFEGQGCHEEWSQWAQACIKGKIAPLEMMAVTTGDGRAIYVSAYAQRFARGLRGYVRDVSDTIESGMNAEDIERQLSDTIEAVPYGVALYDKNNELVFINSKSREIFPGLDDVMQPGARFDDLVRAYFESNLQNVPPEEREEKIQKRLALHRNSYGTREVAMRNDHWVEISEHITPEGNVVISWSDITAVKRREQALSSLLTETDDAMSVPERAAKAVALALDCRWGGVVRLDENHSKKAKIVSLWDHDHFIDAFEYDYAGTPCERVYKQGGYVYLPQAGEYNFSNVTSENGLTVYYGMALRDQKGNLIGHIFAMDDDTKQTEYKHGREVFQLIANWVEMEFRRQALNQSINEAQKRFRDFAEVASDWFWEMKADFTFNFISEHAPANTKEALQQFVRDAYIAEQDDPSAKMRPFRDVEITLKGKEEGEEIACLISARPILDENGHFAGYRGTGTDVTEMMKANQRAARAESWLWEAIESSPEAFILYDKNDRVQLFNSKMLDIFFPKEREKVKPGVTFTELQDLYFSQGISDIPTEHIGHWKENRKRHRGLTDAGEYNEIPVNGSKYLAIEHRTREGGVATFYVDITLMREQEASLLKAKEQAETASRSKSDFLANISHELRTPLNAIIGFSELIRDELAGPPNSPKYKEYISDIHNSGMHLMELINDILDLSKAEAGMIEGANRLVDAVEIVEACVKLMRPKAERAYVKLSANYPEQMPLLWADPKHLRQILLNLVSNAVKFTPEGGSVDIKMTLNDKGLTIAVKDTGIGMNPDDVPKAMSPFGQIDSSLSRKYNGTGLGLPLTKRLMDYYGGDLLIKTAMNKGTTVSIVFTRDRLRYPDGKKAASSAAE
jgi:signal transduction histidine kinase